MAVWIAMLRGVNVGGNHKLPMERLRAICAELHFARPETLIQSGNVIFEVTGQPREVLAKKLETAIEREFGFRPGVVLRSTAELKEAVARNPFLGRDDVDPAKLLITFLKSDPGEEARRAMQILAAGPEELVIEGSEIFIYYPEGAGKSKFPAAKMERAQGVAGTSRNWNTVLKLLSRAEAR